MYYKLSSEQENYLLNKPETGMGYQVVEASKGGNYGLERFLVLNTEVVIEMDGRQGEFVSKAVNEGIYSLKAMASVVTLNRITVLNERQFRNMVNESKNERGAIDNPKEPANGIEVFVRLSAFDDDKRVDKVRKCLKPGSFTTTEVDYLVCKATGGDPIQRYALPSNDTIKWAFHVQPVKNEQLQRGTVQPANNKPGGGKEVYFETGTTQGTFLKQLPY